MYLVSLKQFNSPKKRTTCKYGDSCILDGETVYFKAIKLEFRD